MSGLGMNPEAAAAAQQAATAAAAQQSGVETYSLVDSNGESHQYVTMLHPAEEGIELLWALIAFGGEPLGALAKSALGGLIAEGGEGSSVLTIEAESFLHETDWSAVGRDLSAAIRRSDMRALSGALLKHTHRDGEPLRDLVAFNNAYRGNYGEYLRALAAVLKANRFLPF